MKRYIKPNYVELILRYVAHLVWRIAPYDKRSNSPVIMSYVYPCKRSLRFLFGVPISLQKQYAHKLTVKAARGASNSATAGI